MEALLLFTLCPLPTFPSFIPQPIISYFKPTTSSQGLHLHLKTIFIPFSALLEEETAFIPFSSLVTKEEPLKVHKIVAV